MSKDFPRKFSFPREVSVGTKPTDVPPGPRCGAPSALCFSAGLESVKCPAFGVTVT